MKMNILNILGGTNSVCIAVTHDTYRLYTYHCIVL